MSSCERSCPEEQEKERGSDMSPRIWYGRRVTTGASRSGRLDFGLVYHVGRQPFAFFGLGKEMKKRGFESETSGGGSIICTFTSSQNLGWWR